MLYSFLLVPFVLATMDEKRARCGSGAGAFPLWLCVVRVGRIFVVGKIANSDVHKWEYAQSACSDADPWAREVVLDKHVQEVWFIFWVSRDVGVSFLCQAIEWIAAREPSVVMNEREAMVAKLEEADRAMRETGHQQLWFKGADPSVVQVAGECNGFLFEQLLRASGYRDVECVNLLRDGGFFLLVRLGAGVCGCVVFRRLVSWRSKVD